MYKFQMYDKNLQLQLGDGSSTIILNTKCPQKKIPEELAAFYNFVNTGAVDEKNEFVKYLGKRVEEAAEDEEVDRIMTLDEEMRVRWDRAMKQGEEMGFAKGEISKQKEIARNLKKSGVSVEVIAASTGLGEKEIAEL